MTMIRLAPAFLLCAVALGAEEAPLPRLVVFPFESASADLSAKVTMKFRYKFARIGLYEVPSEIETDETVQSEGFLSGYDAKPEAVAAFAREHFRATFCIYGTVTDYEVRYRFLRFEDGIEVLKEASAPYTDERSISFIVEKLVDDLYNLDRDADLEKEREKDAPLGPNIVPNGDFEKGGERPDGWMDVDNMVVFYVTDDLAHGKVMRFGTDVLLGEYQAWKARRESGAPLRDAPAKTPPQDPGYDTVGGTTGAPYRSDFFPVDPSKAYRLTFEMKGPAGAKLFVKGYARVAGELREVGNAYKACRRRTPEGEWETFTRTFHPFRWSKTRPIEALKVQLFAYWPRGTYSFDNVRIQEMLAKKGTGEEEAGGLDKSPGP
ncbi:MAG: hypothetical protein V2A58_01135 [Planctomycetota bacterium]